MLEAALILLALYAPGHFLGNGLPRKGDGVFELVLLRAVAGVAVAGPVLVSLSLLGWFHTPVILGCLAAGTVAAFFIGRSGARRPAWSWPDLGGLALVAGSLALYARPAEYILNSRDPGVYTLFAAKLARTGALISQDPLVGAVAAFHPFAEGIKYPGFYIFGRDMIVPQFFPGPFAWMGLGNLAGGTWGSLYVVPVMGALAVGVAYALGSDLFGRRAGLLGAALLGAGYTQVWWARHPSSEVVTQLYVLAGLWLTVRFARDGGKTTGILAGLLLGGAMLMRVDAFLAALAVPLLFGYDLLTRRPARRWLLPGVPLALFAGAALLYLNTLGGRYLYTIYTAHGLDRALGYAPYALAILGVLAIGLFVFRKRWGTRLHAWISVRGGDLAFVCALLGAAVALWGYFVLPVPWESLPDGSRNFDAYRSQILVRLVWFTTPAVAVLGLIGFVLAARRLDAPRTLVLCAFLGFGVLYTVVPNVSPDLPWATRRFVPAFFPVLCLLAGHAVVEAGRFAARIRDAGAGVALAVVLAAVAFGWTVYTAAPIIRFQELDGAVAAFERIERRVPEARLVFMEMPDGFDVTASTFEYLYRRPVLPYDRVRFIREVDELNRAGLLEEAVYVTTDGGPAPLISGVDFREAATEDLNLPRLAPVEKELPTTIEALRLRYRVFQVKVER